MKRRLQVLLAVFLSAVLAFALVGCGNSSGGSGNRLRFMTGGESGTYYAYGSVLAQYASNGSYGINITALSSNGSQANLQALQDSETDIAFCQSDITASAYQGTNLFADSAYQDFGVVAALYQEQLQIVTCDPNIKTIDDLRGKTVSVGAASSGVFFNASDVLSVYGIDINNDLHAVYQDFGDSADSLKDNKIDAAFIVSGIPTTAITDLTTTKTTYLLSIDDEHMDKLLASSPYYKKAVIPADTYGTESDVTTVSVSALILANNSVPEDAVYQFTKSLFDGAEQNAAAHAKYAELNLQDATSYTSVPYHPGAAKYYAENGIEVAGYQGDAADADEQADASDEDADANGTASAADADAADAGASDKAADGTAAAN